MTSTRHGSRGPFLWLSVLAASGLCVAAAVIEGCRQSTQQESAESSLEEQRVPVEHDAIWRGLTHPIPPHAMADAIVQMQRLPQLAEAGTAGWNFIGPSRISGGQPLSHGGFNCPLAPFRINVSGRVTAIAVGSNDSVLYAGSAGGGVWKTVDGGANWKPLTDALSLTSGGIPVAANAIGAIAVVPGANPALDTVYVGTGEGNSSCDSEYGQGILKSTDGGTTWDQLGSATFDRLSVGKIAIVPDFANPDNPRILYAAATSGLTNSATAVCVFATTATPGLYRSVNAGASWMRISGTGGLPGLTGTSGSATDVVVDGSQIFKGPLSTAFTDPVCATVYTVATDANQFTVNAAKVQNAAFWSLLGKFTLTQTPVPMPGCTDVRGNYSCVGSTPSLNGPGATIGCLSPNAGYSFNGSFAAGTTFSGTWDINSPAVPVTLNGIAQNSQPVVYAALAGAGGGVFKSTDNGATWSLLGVPTPARRYALDLTPHADRLFAARVLTPAQVLPTPIATLGVPTPTPTPTPGSDFDALYSSSDGGATWAQSAPLPPYAVNSNGGGNCAVENASWYNLALANDYGVGMSNGVFPGYGVYLGLKALYLSTDGGLTFAPWLAPAIETHTDQHAIRVLSSSNIVLGNDGGVFESNGPGQDWVSVNSGLGITQFQGIGLAAAGTQPVSGGTQDNGTNLYTGNPAWTHSDDGDGGFALIDQTNPTIMFDEQFGLSFGRSSSSGALLSYTHYNPPAAADPGQFYLPFAIDPSNHERIFIGTRRLWESCQAGAVNCSGATGNPPNWVELSGATDLTGGCTTGFCDISGIAVAPTDPAVAYVVTSSSGAIGPHAWVSRNSNAASPTFTDITPRDAHGNSLVAGFPLTSVAVSPIAPGTVIITASGFRLAGPGNRVFLSSDFGHSWTDISTPATGFPNIPVLTALFDLRAPATNFLVGTDIGVLATTDVGGSWANFNLNSLPVASVYQLRQNATVIAAATHGRGVWERAEAVVTPSPTPTATLTPTFTPTGTPTSTITPTFTSSPTGTPTPTQTSTKTSTPTATNSATSSAAPTPRPSPTRTSTRTATKTRTRTPARTPTQTPKRTPTRTPTQTPKRTPSRTPTKTPTKTRTRTPTRTPSRIPTRKPTPTASRLVTRTPTATKTPSPTPTAESGAPVIISIPRALPVGGNFVINGSGFTPGSVAVVFVATAAGPVKAGPFTPAPRTGSQLTITLPSTLGLGEGFASVVVVNTDAGFKTSNPAYALLQGDPAAGVPTITSVDGLGLAATSSDPRYATNNVETVVVRGSQVKLGGVGFDAVDGVAVDLFCACAGGKVGPFIIGPGASVTRSKITFALPGSGANVPTTGPGSFVVSNRGSAGTYALKSNAVAVSIGDKVSVTSVTQAVSTLSVNGTGFSPLSVINLFNAQGGGVVNLGGLGPGGSAKIPLSLISSDKITFSKPAGAMPGAAYLQVINPPFVPFSSSGNTPQGEFTLK